MPDTQHREDDGRPLRMSSNANAELRSAATALSSAIGETIVVLECLAAELAIAEQVLEHSGGAQEHRPPSAGDAVAAGMPGAPTRVSASRRRLAVPGWLSRGPRACSVCGRDAVPSSKRELSQAGWAITGHQAICARCSSTGWRLADQGGVPFRTRVSSTVPPTPGRAAGTGPTAQTPSSHTR
jgi:hypothetical protein